MFMFMFAHEPTSAPILGAMPAMLGSTRTKSSQDGAC